MCGIVLEKVFPQGPIANEAMQMREAPKYQGRNITAGRYVEDLIGVDLIVFIRKSIWSIRFL